MKLLRYGPLGSEKPGLLDAQGQIRDLSGHIADITPAQLSKDSLAALAAIDPASLPLVEGSPRYGVPVSGSGKFIAIGLNYADHAAESNMPIPKEPIVFTKAIHLPLRPQRHRRHPQGLEEIRLGSRTRDHHRHQGPVCGRGRRSRPCRGLLRDQ